MGEKTKKKGSISYAKWGYIFIAPFFIIFAVFQLVPLASTIYYSFFEYYRSGLKIIGPNFVGLKNYITLLATDLPKYFGNTLILWIIGFVPQIIVSLLLAAWFTDLRLKLKGSLRMPMPTSAAFTGPLSENRAKNNMANAEAMMRLGM